MKCKNVLVLYRGGGYDGCFWEWNFFSFDKDGNFHNLYSTGRDGIKTFEQAIAIMDNVPAERSSMDSVYVYDIEKEEDIKEFQECHAVPIVVGIVNALNQGSEKYGKYSKQLWFECDECGEETDGSGYMENWHGCGGIMSTAETKLCEDCHCSLTCSECGEYDKSCKENGGLCSCCYESSLETTISELDYSCLYLQYHRFSNTLSEEFPSDFLDCDCLKSDHWVVTLNAPDGAHKYIIEGINADTALEDVRSHYGKMYYTAESVSLKDFIVEEGL